MKSFLFSLFVVLFSTNVHASDCTRSIGIVGSVFANSLPNSDKAESVEFYEETITEKGRVDGVAFDATGKAVIGLDQFIAIAGQNFGKRTIYWATIVTAKINPDGSCTVFSIVPNDKKVVDHE